MDGDARKLGERLLGEVESEGLSEVCTYLLLRDAMYKSRDGR